MAFYLSPEKLICSIIGPLLFILYVNDLPSYDFSSAISIYADYTVFYYKHDDLETLYDHLQTDLNILE